MSKLELNPVFPLKPGTYKSGMLMMQYLNNSIIFVATLLLGSAIPAFGATAADDEVKQKLNFVDMFISSSAASTRVAASNHEEAKAKYQAAQERLMEAKSALAAGNFQEAKTKSDEAMNLMARAAQLVPSASSQQMARSRNEKLTQSIEALRASYTAALSEPGAGDLHEPDSGKIQGALDTAKSLAEAGKYEDANKILAATMSEVSDALKKLHSRKTISYEMQFSSQAEEYAYELERYASLENIIPLAIEKKRPSQNELNLVQASINKGKEKRQQADANAKQGKYIAALEEIRSGTQQLETALRQLGITY